MKDFTVIGIFIDNFQSWVEPVRAMDPEEASKKAAIEITKRNSDLTRSDIAVVEVIEGTYQGQLGNDHLLSGSDLS